MLFHVGFASFFGVMPGMVRMARGSVGMMGCLFVLPAAMMFRCLAMMTRGIGEVFLRLRVMFSCLLRHKKLLWRWGCKGSPGATLTVRRDDGSQRPHLSGRGDVRAYAGVCGRDRRSGG
jgi:hypothetical protein